MQTQWKTKRLNKRVAVKSVKQVLDILGDDFKRPADWHRVSAALADTMPNLPTEAHLLTTAYRYGTTRILESSAQGGDVSRSSESLLQELITDHYSEEGARFAVGVWAESLGLDALPDDPKRSEWASSNLLLLIVVPALLLAVAFLPSKPNHPSLAPKSATLPAVSIAVPEASNIKPPEKKKTISPTKQADNKTLPFVSPESNTTLPTEKVVVPLIAPMTDNSPPLRATGTPPPLIHPSKQLKLSKFPPVFTRRCGYPLPHMGIQIADEGYVTTERGTTFIFRYSDPLRPRIESAGDPASASRTFDIGASTCHIVHASRHNFRFFFLTGEKGYWILDAYAFSVSKKSHERQTYAFSHRDFSWKRIVSDVLPTSPDLEEFTLLQLGQLTSQKQLKKLASRFAGRSDTASIVEHLEKRFMYGLLASPD